MPAVVGTRVRPALGEDEQPPGIPQRRKARDPEPAVHLASFADGSIGGRAHRGAFQHGGVLRRERRRVGGARAHRRGGGGEPRDPYLSHLCVHTASVLTLPNDKADRVVWLRWIRATETTVGGHQYSAVLLMSQLLIFAIQ